MQLVDREKELRELRQLTSRKGPSIALLYGRRRIGKTFLLDHAWEDPFYFLAADTSSKMNRMDLLRELKSWAGVELELEDFPTWRSVFRLMIRLAAKKPLIVILDEFQHLMGREDDIVSQLVAVWDREVADLQLSLVLCGSEESMMERLAGGDSALYGRVGWSARLSPFDYCDSSLMLTGRAFRELAYFYGILGGIPHFLAAVRPDERLQEAIGRLVLSPRGEIHLQLENLIAQERGIRHTSEYDAVLRAVARGSTKLSKIASGAGLSERPHVARRALDILQKLRLVSRQRNFRSHRRAQYRYEIADNAVLFWHRFVEPNRSMLEREHIRPVWEQRIRPNLDTYMGVVYESMAIEYLERFGQTRDLPAMAETAGWQGRDRNRRSIEIDLVCELESGELLTGEVKWSSKPVDPRVHFSLRRDLEDLSNSGKAWAGNALKGYHIYFSAGGFTEPLLNAAEKNDRIRLVDLEDMYATR
ncbi:AAA family ATPase [Candidatus Fermentibacteria bacterium]|nr:AAA family ATPase [Candidatus Fermentibacteria bacterium]